MKKLLSALFLLLSMQLSSSELTWSSPPITISTSGVDASNALLAMDSSANVVAVWLESGVVRSSTLLSGGSWSSPVSVSGSGASAPQLVVDPAGNATAVWVQSGGIEAATLPFGGSWGGFTTLAASGSSDPQIAVDPSGDVVAVWVTSGAIESTYQIFGGSWQLSPATLASSGDSPQVAISANGTVIAVWHTFNSISLIDNISAATNTVGGTWSAASTVSNPAVNSVNPQVAIDPNGNATAIWFTYNLSGIAYSDVFLYASALPSGGSWSTPVVISMNGSQYNPASLTSSILYGDASFPIAVWTSSFDGSSFSIESAQNINNTGWTAYDTLAQDIHAMDISMAVTSGSDAFAVYMTYDGASSVNINAVNAHLGGAEGGLWFDPTTISTGTSNAFPQIATVLTGGNTDNAVALWLNYDGTNKIVQALTGTGTLVTPPSGVSVVQGVNDFGVFQEYYNTVSWTASPDPNVVAYGIYRNGVLLTSVGSGTSDFVDDNKVQNGSVTYGVSALDDAGSESAVITVSFP